jgi:peptidoglycan-associated lipoprotein
MIKLNRIQKSLFVLGLAAALTACSSKKSKDDGDTAATDGKAPTDIAGVGQRIPELQTVYFAYDSFSLTGESKGALEANANWLKANSGRRVQIEGHTDERGTTEYNLALGDRRAGAVRDYLVSKGVSASQLTTISYGEERPSKNRRAEFVSGQ